VQEANTQEEWCQSLQWGASWLRVVGCGLSCAERFVQSWFCRQSELFYLYSLYILAQALERVTEVITYLIPGIGAINNKTKDKAISARDAALQRAVSALSPAAGAAQPAADEEQPAAGAAQTAATEAAKEQANVNAIRDNRTLFLWGLNVGLAAVCCGLLGLFLLDTIGVDGVFPIVDIFVTGLVVGSGTKPLHDLISNIQKAKEEKEDTPKKV
jgi:hypothetical protein